MSKPTGILVAVGIIAIVGVVAAILPMNSLQGSSTGEHKFVIDTPMQRVRKILVRTNAVKKIVAMADAKLLDQEWLQMRFEIDRPILKRDWHLEGEGKLVVQTDDSYLGRHEITLQQSVDITPDRVYVTNVLLNPSAPDSPIQEYSSTLELAPDEYGNAQLTTSLKLEIKTKASWLTRSIVESSIRNAAQKSLEKQEQAIREIVEQHSDDLIILPGSDNDG